MINFFFLKILRSMFFLSSIIMIRIFLSTLPLLIYRKEIFWVVDCSHLYKFRLLPYVKVAKLASSSLFPNFFMLLITIFWIINFQRWRFNVVDLIFELHLFFCLLNMMKLHSWKIKFDLAQTNDFLWLELRVGTSITHSDFISFPTSFVRSCWIILLGGSTSGNVR